MWFLHPGRLTWNLRIIQLKRKIIFETIIFRFHVNLPGCNGRLVLQFYHVFFLECLLRDPLYELSIQFSWQTLQRPLAFWFIEEWRRRSFFLVLGVSVFKHLHEQSRTSHVFSSERDAMCKEISASWQAWAVLRIPIFWSYFHISFSSRCRTRLLMCSKTWRKWTFGIFTVEHVW